MLPFNVPEPQRNHYRYTDKWKHKINTEKYVIPGSNKYFYLNYCSTLCVYLAFSHYIAQASERSFPMLLLREHKVC